MKGLGCESLRKVVYFFICSQFLIFILNYNLREAFSSQFDLLQIDGEHSKYLP